MTTILRQAVGYLGAPGCSCVHTVELPSDPNHFFDTNAWKARSIHTSGQSIFHSGPSYAVNAMQDAYTAPDPAHSVLLTIDVQCDFSEPGAVAEIPGTSECVPVMRRVLDAYRQHRLPIVHVVRLYHPSGTNAELCRRAAIENRTQIVAPGSRGSQLMPSLRRYEDLCIDPETVLAGNLQGIADNEWIMYKPRWDAFYATPLEQHIRDLGVTTVVVTGCNFPNCPRATIYGASMRDLRTVMIVDAVSALYERGLCELAAIGVATLSATEYLAYLSDACQESTATTV